jgi:hypothetical protein
LDDDLLLFRGLLFFFLALFIYIALSILNTTRLFGCLTINAEAAA